MNLVRAAAVVGSNTMLSRVLGFVRDVAMANVLGAGVVSDAFFVAFKLANFLRRLFAEGAFNAAFVPMVSRALETNGPADARRFAGEALAGLALVLVLVVIAAELFMPELVGVLAGGYGPDDPRLPLAVELSHITFPYILLISLAALLGGMLNAVGRFGAAAFAPVLLNLVLIAALLASPWLPVGPAHALAWGVAIAGVAQLAFLTRAAARAEMLPTLTRPRWNPRIRRLALLVLPGALGAGVAQVNMLVDLWFASHLPPGAQSYLFYADRLNQLPLGVVGIAVGTALLPVLSREVAAGDALQARGTLNRAIRLALLLTLPATAALVLIAQPIVVGLFERGAFDAAASRATAATVQAFAVGLPAYVLVKVMAPAFFAREDTRTPVLVAAVALVANIALILVFIDALAHVGIALATALANWLNVVLLAVLLARAGWFRPDRALAAHLARALAATLVMAAVLVGVDRLAMDWPALVRLGALVGAGGAAFAVAALAFGAVPGELRRLVARRAPG
ncbi:MAG: murein biosynthesis integral membrane protein MurJ [Alphaproteobacteria bacterium]|nr:murein biosynthesis integral membrane protein MurJ [Alphaproteobacteria bacterium]